MVEMGEVGSEVKGGEMEEVGSEVKGGRWKRWAVR